jgi:hypothetical protein
MNPIIEVLIAYRDGKPVDVSDHLTAAIVTKLVRRGCLSKSVVSGEIAMNDHGAKMLGKALLCLR